MKAELKAAAALLDKIGPMVEEARGPLQEILDDLEEKQAERDSDARQQKIDDLQALIDALDELESNAESAAGMALELAD